MRIVIFGHDFEKYGLDITDPNFSEIAVNYLQDNYFNGADSAVIYISEFNNGNNTAFEFDLIPG